MKELLVYDLLVLEVLQAEQPSYRELFAKVNSLIAARGMSSNYVTSAANKSAVENSLRRLRDGGLIDAPTPTGVIQRPAVVELIKHIGTDWQQWPYYIPILDGELDYEHIKERIVFEVAKPVSKKLKVLVFGDAGSGKTRFGLTFPDVAVIDTENGTDLYAGRPGVAEFKVLRAKTMVELDKAIDFVRSDGGKTIGTLFIDSMTVFYDVLLDAKRRTLARTKNMPVDDIDLGYKERASVNTRMKGIYARLTGLPVHVVVTAREADLYITEGSVLKKVGTKPDLDKAVKYMFDFVIQMNPDHSATVIKSRGSELKSMKNPTWDDFKKIANLFVSGDTTIITSEEEAAEEDSQREAAADFQNHDTVKKFFAQWEGQGLTIAGVLEALKINRASEWTQGLTAANKAVEKWRSENFVPE